MDDRIPEQEKVARRGRGMALFIFIAAIVLSAIIVSMVMGIGD